MTPEQSIKALNDAFWLWFYARCPAHLADPVHEAWLASDERRVAAYTAVVTTTPLPVRSDQPVSTACVHVYGDKGATCVRCGHSFIDTQP